MINGVSNKIKVLFRYYEQLNITQSIKIIWIRAISSKSFRSIKEDVLYNISVAENTVKISERSLLTGVKFWMTSWKIYNLSQNLKMNEMI